MSNMSTRQKFTEKQNIHNPWPVVYDNKPRRLIPAQHTHVYFNTILCNLSLHMYIYIILF